MTLIIGTLTCYNNQGALLANVLIEGQMIAPPQGETGNAYSGEIFAQISNGSGVVTFVNLVSGATYRFRRNGGDWTSIVAQLASGEETLPLGDLLGKVC